MTEVVHQAGVEQGAAPVRVGIRALDQPGDLGWVVMAHGEIYAAEFGWDTDFEALVARIVADYAGGHDPTREAAWIAELDGRRVGCIFCVAADATTATLHILLVDPRARGHGIGARLVSTCLSFARDAGYRYVTLWTNDVLISARRLYQAAEFVLIKQEAHHSFGQDLIGQNWKLDLGERGRGQSPHRRRFSSRLASQKVPSGKPTENLVPWPPSSPDRHCVRIGAECLPERLCRYRLAVWPGLGRCVGAPASGEITQARQQLGYEPLRQLSGKRGAAHSAPVTLF